MINENYCFDDQIEICSAMQKQKCRISIIEFDLMTSTPINT